MRLLLGPDLLSDIFHSCPGNPLGPLGVFSLLWDPCFPGVPRIASLVIFSRIFGLVPVGQDLHKEAKQSSSHPKSQEDEDEEEGVKGQLVLGVVLEGEGFDT